MFASSHSWPVCFELSSLPPQPAACRFHEYTIPSLLSQLPKLHEHVVSSRAFGLSPFNEHKYPIGLTEKSRLPPCFFYLHSLSMLHHEKSLEARILLIKVIVPSILVPCQAKESAAAARIILMTSLESSHLRHNAVPMFARA